MGAVKAYSLLGFLESVIGFESAFAKLDAPNKLEHEKHETQLSCSDLESHQQRDPFGILPASLLSRVGVSHRY